MSQVDAEFDRVRRVLEYARRKQSPEDVRDIESIIRILEEKRAEVKENEQAQYFIHDWQELWDQVSQMIVEDPQIQSDQGWPDGAATEYPDLKTRESREGSRT